MKIPPNKKFHQQKMGGKNPLLTPKCVLPFCYLFSAIFLVLAVTLFVSISKVDEITQRYDKDCTTKCNITIEPTKDMLAPVYFYYQLTNYHQNHRKYIKSRSDKQLRGETLSYADSSVCDPIRSYDDKESAKEVYDPCGLVAWSKFNDTFTIMEESTQKSVGFTEKGIAWESDLDEKFKNPDPLPDPDSPTTIQSNYQDEHFIVWMRVAPLPTFRKLYAILKTGKLEKNKKYTIQIENNYPVHQFEGTKSIAFSTSTWIGGKNAAISWCYLVIGLLLLVLSISFTLKHLLWGRELGNSKYLSWNKN
ncbi:cell cycle control protein [Anaeramoeba flamelloides]|uniref:Cell cycle control protein n=1 Tax=Anaeramoeba flamelloides TaxID=1746091 RepID=A0AAV7ZKC9_9EUKA|nr:cell cycle control protein [Anaeramoeba flamelloides]